jgi:hypothetical protein
MQTVRTIGLDIAKSVFQIHGIDAAGQVVIRRQLKRRYVLAFFQKLPPCLVGLEACARSYLTGRTTRHCFAGPQNMLIGFFAAQSRLISRSNSQPSSISSSIK